MTISSTREFVSTRKALPPNNPDRIDRYYYPGEMDEAFQQFTFHVSFSAHDEGHARILAERYACGLNQMRLEVNPYSAQISTRDDWTTAKPVVCMAKGPHPTDLCTELAGHLCDHNGPGVTRTWSEDKGEEALAS